MIRIGRYDALDKWEFVCRHWEHKNSLPDLGVDKFDRPRLSRWDAMAVSSGSAACLDYIRLKARSLTTGATPGEPPAADESPIACEIARLLKQLGSSGLENLVRELAEAITRQGFRAAANDRFSPQLGDRLKHVFKTGALDRLWWTEEPGEVPTIEIIRAQRPISFPTDAIKDKRNALCLFCARFYGRSDVIHVYDIRPDHMTLVDNDAQSIDDMKLIYPSDWSYVKNDYREFLRQAAESKASYDLIVCDYFPWIAREVVWDNLSAIMDICSDMLIANYFGEMLNELGVGADDLQGLSNAVAKKTGVDIVFRQMMARGPDVYWAVMHKRLSRGPV